MEHCGARGGSEGRGERDEAMRGGRRSGPREGRTHRVFELEVEMSAVCVSELQEHLHAAGVALPCGDVEGAETLLLRRQSPGPMRAGVRVRGGNY